MATNPNIMKATYKVVKTIDGHRNGTVIDTFDNIEDARKQLARELWYCEKNNWHYFANSADAESEIAYAQDALQEGDWDEDFVEDYTNVLRRGIESGKPFMVDFGCPCAAEGLITLERDSFYFDNYRVEIEEEPATCAPFEPGTSYPVLAQDAQGNNQSVNYCDGGELVGLSYLRDFDRMGEAFQSQILDNANEEDKDAIEFGQVWANDESTLFAILYGE